jgi:hypothetical protein
MFGKLGIGAATTVSALLIGASPAAAAAQPSIAFTGGVVVAKGDVASLRITYTCTSTDTPANHLFVAVKQGEGVSPEHSSSEDPAAQIDSFYSTNWSADEGPNALRCDGKRHVQTVVLTPQGTETPLQSGTALVQLCIYDNITGFDGFEPIGGANRSYTMQRVVAAGH